MNRNCPITLVSLAERIRGTRLLRPRSPNTLLFFPTSSHVKIAVDAMGGDRAPAQVLEGVCLAARDLDVDIILVGDEPVLRRHLQDTVADIPPTISIRHASQQVEMHDQIGRASVRERV